MGQEDQFWASLRFFSAMLDAAIFLDAPPAVTAAAAQRIAHSIRYTRLHELGAVLSSVVSSEDAFDLVLAQMSPTWQWKACGARWKRRPSWRLAEQGSETKPSRKYVEMHGDWDNVRYSYCAAP